MPSRRAFLGWVATSVPLAIIVRRADALAIDEIQRGPSTLRALGQAILPGELGPAGIDAEVASFQLWIAGYKENAEQTHGYGTSRLSFTGPTPATRWMKQLDELEAAAKTKSGKAFAALPQDDRRAIVREVLAAERNANIGNVVSANHVAVALLSHFYGSPAATDLAYEARIGKSTCRPLASSSAKPVALRRAPRSLGA